MFRLICLNNVTKTDIYTFLHCLSLDSLDLRINLIVENNVEKSRKSFIRTFNAVITKYALFAKPRGCRGGEQSAPQNETAEAQ